MAIVFVVYHSGFGHTKLQAEAVHRGAASVEGIKAEIRTSEQASANRPEDFQHSSGPSPEALNRLGSFTGAMSASFQIQAPDAPLPGDIQTAELYGKRVAEVTARWVKAKSL